MVYDTDGVTPLHDTGKREAMIFDIRMASARPASSLRQEDDTAVPNINAQQQQQGGLYYHYEDWVFTHSYDNDILLIGIFFDDCVEC